MMKISNPVLAPVNNQAVYLYNEYLMLLDEAFQIGEILLEGIDGASHLKWSLDGLYVGFILNGQLKIVIVTTRQVMEAPFQNVSQYEWGADTVLYVTAKEGALYKWSLQDEAQLLLEQASIEAYSAAQDMMIVKRVGQLFACKLNKGEVEELQEITKQTGQYGQAAFSFTGQYVAYTGETVKERHVYVYDFELGITQNLTEMLDVYAGDAMNPHTSDKQGLKEIQWTETDALYFQLSIDGDVRLYYADLYGSLFPASPESEHIVSYTVANSGNWVLYVADKPFQETRLDWFDITMGEGRKIVNQSVPMPRNVEVYYEMVEVADMTLYVWSYVPAQCEAAYVVLSGQGRMLGNGYEPRLESGLNENKAVVYVNHPGAFGYGTAYAGALKEVNHAQLLKVITDWLIQKVGRTIRIE